VIILRAMLLLVCVAFLAGCGSSQSDAERLEVAMNKENGRGYSFLCSEVGERRFQCANVNKKSVVIDVRCDDRACALSRPDNDERTVIRW